MATDRICSISDCGKPHYGKGWCVSHYTRWRRNGAPELGRATHGVPMQWLLEHVSHSGIECLIWPFGRLTNGYVTVRLDGKSRIGSRVMCELAHGTPPTPKHEAAHACGKGHLGCINPKHLSWRLPAENAQDKLKHGTSPRGENSPSCVLTASQVLEICSLLDSGVGQSELGRRYGVSNYTIFSIHKGRNWGWLTGRG
jgi:hypothetical protein